jgi:hypothetical protein
VGWATVYLTWHKELRLLSANGDELQMILEHSLLTMMGNGGSLNEKSVKPEVAANMVRRRMEMSSEKMKIMQVTTCTL